MPRLMPLSRIRWTMAHEARHLKQQDRTFDCASKPCQKLLQLTQNDIRLVFQENRETDADIGGTLIIEDGYAGAEALWHSYLLDPSNSIATKKEQRERESFCIRYDHTTCDKEAFIRRNGAYPLNHPPYVSCRIPRMLEAAEKYKEADAKLKKEIKEKFAHAQQNNFE